MNYKTYGETIWEEEKFGLQVNVWQGRYFLIDSESGEKLNELINGKESLTKYYKGDILEWVRVIIEKQKKARLKEHNYYLSEASKQLTLYHFYKEMADKLKGY